MRNATTGSVAILLSLLFACGGQPAPTESASVSALLVPNCPPRDQASPESYIHEATGQRKRFWGPEYESCPNTDSPSEFRRTPFEQALQSAGCINRTPVSPNNEIGADCRSSWEVALCPAGAAIDDLVRQYSDNGLIRAQRGPKNGAVDCSATNPLTGNPVATANPSPSAGMVVVKWDPTDGSQPLVNAATTTNPAVVPDYFNHCRASDGTLITDGITTCKSRRALYSFFDDTLHCQPGNGSCL